MAGTDHETWDSNIVIACFGGVAEQTKRGPEVMRKIRLSHDKFIAGKLRISTSIITLIEVLKSKNDDAHMQLLKLRESQLFRLVDVTFEIAELSHSIRAGIDEKPGPSGKALSVPDSIHLATAIVEKSGSLITTDERDSRRKHEQALIPLSPRMEELYGLRVHLPTLTALERETWELEQRESSRLQREEDAKLFRNDGQVNPRYDSTGAVADAPSALPPLS